MAKENTYDLIITGYDWGPAVDKIIIHTESIIKSLNKDDFSVYTKTYGPLWITFPPKTKLHKGKRNIIDLFYCDEHGACVKNPSKSICLCLEVHPDDLLANPFLYSSDCMNHWQSLYDVEITSEKHNICINELGKKISPLADQFDMKECKTDDITLHYGLWKPEKKQSKLPLIIWLHGMGEGGTDPYIVLLGNKVVNLITDDVQKCFGESGACVLTPQADGFWMQTTSDKNPAGSWISEKSEFVKSYYTKALKNLIDNVLKENPEIDSNRIYIGGCSNGGYMTMNMILEYPDYFAAAYPVCQAYPDKRISDEQIKILSKQHIWFTQSKDDMTVTPQKFSIPTVKRILEQGGADIHFSLWENVSDTTGLFKGKKETPYKYNGHFSWIYVLNNECVDNNQTIFEWMSGITK